MELKETRVSRVDTDILTVWRNKKMQGDIEAISEKYGIDRRKISTAFSTGRAKPNVFMAINSYYGIQSGNAA